MMRSRIAAMVVAASVLIGGYGAATSGPADPGTANLWVDTSGGTCAWSATAVAYSDAAACGSLNAAYDTANSNSPTAAATVRVKAGSYGYQRIDGDRTGPGLISLLGDSGVVTNEIELGEGIYATQAPDYLAIVGPDPANGSYWTDAQGVWCIGDCLNITIDGFDGGALAIDDFGNAPPNEPANWTVKNSDWGPCAPNEGPSPRFFDTHCRTVGGLGSGQIEITGGNKFDFFNNTIHDFDDICSGAECSPPGDVHFECVRGVGGGAGIWRGNRFWGCEIYSINLGPGPGETDPAKLVGPNLVIENNWFGGSDGTSGAPYGFSVGIPDNANAPVTIRNNSFQDGDGILHDVPSPPAGIFTVSGNLIGQQQCISGVTYQFNIYDDNQGTCAGTGESAIAGEFPYTNPLRGNVMNYHISGTSWLGDDFVTTGCPSVDYDDGPRGATCDAGSDER